MFAKGREAGSQGTKWPSYEEQSLSPCLNQPLLPARLSRIHVLCGEYALKKNQWTVKYDCLSFALSYYLNTLFILFITCEGFIDVDLIPSKYINRLIIV